jgi:hypothetical protein
VLWWPTAVDALLDLGDVSSAASLLAQLEAVTARDAVDLGVRLATLRGRLAMLDLDRWVARSWWPVIDAEPATTSRLHSVSSTPSELSPTSTSSTTI